MKVELFDYSQNGLNNVITAGRNCYQSKSKNYADDVKLAKALVKQDHTPIEFGWTMWHISGISRACADQLARYRVASHSIMSQRYVNIKDIEFVHPYSVLKLAGESALAIEKAQRDFYNLLIKNGIAKEDARYYMGIGFATEMYIGCNFRELRHILKQRLDNHAQWEIRQVAQEIYNICSEKFFWLVEDINV